MANTSFKLVDYGAAQLANQYDFTFPTGWEPLNEAQTATVNLEKDKIPYRHLSWLTDYGVAERIITMQGRDITYANRYALAASMLNHRIKKLYLGEDWYYYVRGITPNSLRDVNLPTLHSYTASFLALDPRMYYDGAANGDYPAGTSGFGYLSVSGGNLTLDLTAKGSWCVEPTFWISGESGNTIKFRDERAMELQFTPPDGGLWIVMPYRNNYVNGFHPNFPIAYKAQSWALANYDSSYAPDAQNEATSPQFIETTGNISTGITPNDVNSKGWVETYPQFTWGKSSAISVSGAGDVAHVKAQYRYVRM